MSKNNEVLYDAITILDEDIHLSTVTSDGANSLIDEAKKKVKAFTKLIEAREKRLLDLLNDHNQLVQEIIDWHDARLAKESHVEVYNNHLKSTVLSGISSSPASWNAYDPNTSQYAENYLSGINKTAWISNIRLNSPIIGFNRYPQENDLDDVIEEIRDPKFVVFPNCKEELVEDSDAQGNFIFTSNCERDWTGELRCDDAVKMVCPEGARQLANTEIAINKYKIKIHGYDLEGENPIEQIFDDDGATLTTSIAGVGTFSEWTKVGQFYDRGVNRDNSGSWSYGGQTYSGSIEPGSSNYNNFVLPRLTRMDKLEDRAKNKILPDVQALKDLRLKHDLYLWSLEYTRDSEKNKVGKLEEIRPFIENIQEDYESEMGIPSGNIEDEVSPFKDFNALSERDKKQLSLKYGLGVPKDTKLRDVDGRVLKDSDGNIMYVSDAGFNKNYDEIKLKNFVSRSEGFKLTGDYVITKDGSIVVVDSAGNEERYVGLLDTSQTLTGSMSTTNIGSVVSFANTGPGPAPVIEYGDLMPPGAGIVTFSGSIGVETSKWREVHARAFVGNLAGAATSVFTYSASTLNENIPILMGHGGAGSSTRVITNPTIDTDFTFNPLTNTLSVGEIVVDEITVISGSTGIGTVITVRDGDSNYTSETGETEAKIGFITGISTNTRVYTSDNFKLIPSTGEFQAVKFVGVGSFTNLTSIAATTGVLSATSAVVGDIVTIDSTGISLPGVISIGNNISLNGTNGTIVASAATISGNLTVGGTITYDDVTNVDSLGLVTARSGVHIGESTSVGATLSPDGSAVFSDVVTAEQFSGNLSGMGITVTSARITGLNVVGVATIQELNVGSNNLSLSGILTANRILSTDVNVSGVATIATLDTTTVDATDIRSTGITTTNTQVGKYSNFEDIVVDNVEFISDGTINATFDTIDYDFHPLGKEIETGEEYIYIASGSGVIGGLTNNQSYYLQNVGTANSFKVYTDSAFLNLVEVTYSTSGIHTFRKTNSGIATISVLKSDYTEVIDLNVSGVGTFAHSALGISTANSLKIVGSGIVTTFNVTDADYDYLSGIATITVDSDITFDINDLVRIENLDFRTVGADPVLLPNALAKNSYPIRDIDTLRIFEVNFGTYSESLTYNTGGTIEIGLSTSYLLPAIDGESGYVLTTDGAGITSFTTPDIYGGHRIYVSSLYGNDSNDGTNAPVKSIQRACELSSSLSYTGPVSIFVATGEYVENNPIIVPDNVSILGDSLREVTIRPQNSGRDIFRVRNGCYIAEVVFKDNISLPIGLGVRNDTINKARDYAKVLIGANVGTATSYRTNIDITENSIIEISRRAEINSRIDELAEIATQSILNEQTLIPKLSSGNSDQEYFDAANLIFDNTGSTAGVASTSYIVGNAVGWATAISGGNYSLDDDEIFEFEKEVNIIFRGISDDLRYGGRYGSEHTLKSLRSIIIGTPSFTWNYAVAFDDPTDSTIDRSKYVGLSDEKPTITRSPYVQNCSIISFLGGNGANVDGSKIADENIPFIAAEAETPQIGDIPDQGKSMVANSFTCISFGGVGWKVSNSGYAQMVSCFQIFCQNGSYCQSGGYLSITNSATNFGLYALRASGFRSKSFNFDRGIIVENGTFENAQTLKISGLGRADQQNYILKFINATTGSDDTQNFKISGITTQITGPTDINVSGDTINIGNIGSQLNNGDAVLYEAPSSNLQIGGLIDDTSYFIKIVGAGQSTAELYFDEDLNTKVNFTSAPTGIHTFTKVAEEFTVGSIVESHSIYQNLTLSDSIGVGVTFDQGTPISQTRTDTTVAVGFAVSWTSTVLTVSVENSTNLTGGTERLLFQSLGGTISDKNNTTTSVNSIDNRSDLNTIRFKVESTVSGSSVQNADTLPLNYRVNLHRPSIVNSSSHTWEYAGSGIDYNALPENGGQTREEFEQLSENGGRVYSSGTNELGDFKIGESITAFNRSGQIEFNNRVTIGQLDSLELSLSGGVSITEISTDKDLGFNDSPGSPLDSRLITQAAAYGYLQNHLGPFIDQNKSTAALPSAVPQLNSQGQLDPGMIPASIRFNEVYDTVGGGRTDLCNDIPAIEVLKSDIVTETSGGITTNYTLVFENDSQFLILSSDTNGYNFNNGDSLTASQNGAIGIVTTPTHVSYGSTGLVKGVINTITLTNGGSGYSVAGIYSGVQLESITGIGTSGIADITVGATGSIEAINMRRGGRYYSSGDTFLVDPNDIGGASIGFTTFTASIENIDTRLYVKLTGNKQQFFASQSVPDFISDGTSVSISTDFSTTYTASFIPTSVGVAGSVYFSENSILLPPDHDFEDGDSVNYIVTAGTAVDNLVSGTTYYIRKVGVSSIRLSEDYAGNTIVTLISSGTGTHQLRRVGVNTTTDQIIVKNHTFTTGNSVKLTASDPPEGLLNNNYYFVGSVTDNGFTLHDVRQDALNSINGSTISAVDLTDSGSSTGSFTEQNVSFVKAVNTSSNNPSNFSVLASSNDIDADNIISGVIDTDRLAVNGTANNLSFLRGDQTWSSAVQTISVGVGTTSAIIVDTEVPGQVIVGSGINTYYGKLNISVSGVTTAGIGLGQYSNIGVVRLQVNNGSGGEGPFKVGSDFTVNFASTLGDTNNNSIDAKQLGGQSLSEVVNLSNSSVNGNSRGILNSNNGGTGVDNSNAVDGQIMISNSTRSPADFTATSYPQIAGGLGIGYHTNIAATGVKGTIDLAQIASLDAKSTSGVATTSATSVFTFDKTIFRTAKVIVSITDNVNSHYHATECLIIHNGTTAHIVEYGTIYTNSELSTFTVDIDGNNVRLLATSVNANSKTFNIMASSLVRV